MARKPRLTQKRLLAALDAVAFVLAGEVPDGIDAVALEGARLALIARMRRKR